MNFAGPTTYLPANVMGRWFHLYLILDLYSRKIVGAEVGGVLQGRRSTAVPDAET